MGTHPHLARERQRGMPAQPDQRLTRQVRDRASAPAPDGRWITVAPPAARVVVALIAAGDRMPAGVETGIRFHTDGADAAHGALRARGVQVSELLRWPGLPAMFTVTDVDGNHFQIVE